MISYEVHTDGCRVIEDLYNEYDVPATSVHPIQRVVLCLKSPILHLGVSLEFWSQPGVSASQQQQISQLAEVVL